MMTRTSLVSRNVPVGLLLAAIVLVSAASYARTPKGGADGVAPASTLLVDSDRAKPKKGALKCLAFSPDGKLLVTCLGEDNAKVWSVDGNTAMEKQKLDQGGTLATALFSPDGSRLVLVGLGGPVKVWDVGTGKSLVTLQDALFESASYHPDGKTLVLGDTRQKAFTKDANLWFVDVATGKVVRKVPTGLYTQGNVIVVEQGRKVVHSDPAESGTLFVRDFDTGTVVKKLEGHTAGARVFAAPDGRSFVSCATPLGKPGEVMVWTVEKPAKELALSLQDGDSQIPKEAALTPDNQYIVVLMKVKGKDKEGSRVEVFDRANGKRVGMSTLLDADADSLAISPDGKTIVAGGRRLVKPGVFEGVAFFFQTSALLGQ